MKAKTILNTKATAYDICEMIQSRHRIVYNSQNSLLNSIYKVANMLKKNSNLYQENDFVGMQKIIFDMIVKLESK